MKVLTVKARLPDQRGKVKFANFDEPCFVLTPDKAKADARNFREASNLITRTGERAQAVGKWLNDLADKYDGGDVSGSSNIDHIVNTTERPDPTVAPAIPGHPMTNQEPSA